jgi:retron-type reverse transcriptase
MEVLKTFSVHACAHGFITGRSIVTNAKPHVGQGFVLNIDLKDFFPTVDRSKVEAVFLKYGLSGYEDIVLLDNVLPQGSPTSPVISNLAMFDLDTELQALANDYGYNLTRYADDITFSGKVYSKTILSKVYSLICKHGFNPNKEKTKLFFKSQRQVVTGLVVNEKVNITRKLRRKIRAMKHQEDSLTEMEKQWLAGMNGITSML